MEKSTWIIKNVPEQAKRVIKAYAAKKGLSIGDALNDIAKGL